MPGTGRGVSGHTTVDVKGGGGAGTDCLRCRRARRTQHRLERRSEEQAALSREAAGAPYRDLGDFAISIGLSGGFTLASLLTLFNFELNKIMSCSLSIANPWSRPGTAKELFLHFTCV